MHATFCVAGLMTALILGDCQAQLPATQADISAATGIADAIMFRQDAEPLDAAPAPAELSLAQAVRQALMHDPRFQQSLAEVRLAEADANQARLLPNPILAIDVRVPPEHGINTAFEATLTGDLVSLLQKPAQISAADKRLRASSADALTQALDIIIETQQAFIAAASADAEIQNAADRRKILQQLRDIAQNRLSAGEAARVDVLALDAQLAQSRLDLMDSQLARTSARLTLARLIGQPRGGIEWQLQSDLAAQSASGSMAPESAWIDVALQKRPEIQSKTWDLRALGDDLSAAAFSPFVGGEEGAHAEHDPLWRVGPTVTVPLPVFDFGQANRDRIEQQRVAARQGLLESERQIVEDVRQAYAAFAQAGQSLSAAQDQLLPLQKQELDQARLAYQAGESDLATLLLAESDMQATISRITELQEKVLLTRLKLQRAAGGAAVSIQLESASPPPRPTETTPTTAPATGIAP